VRHAAIVAPPSGTKWNFPAMDNNGTMLPSPAPAGEKKRRGRPQAGPETHKQRVARLQAELKEAQAAMKLADEKRAGIVGAAALRHARHNVEFSRQLAAALRAEIKAKADRAAIADLMDGAED
jgi:hypothetical protein